MFKSKYLLFFLVYAAVGLIFANGGIFHRDPRTFATIPEKEVVRSGVFQQRGGASPVQVELQNIFPKSPNPSDLPYGIRKRNVSHQDKSELDSSKSRNNSILGQKRKIDNSYYLETPTPMKPRKKFGDIFKPCFLSQKTDEQDDKVEIGFKVMSYTNVMKEPFYYGFPEYEYEVLDPEVREISYPGCCLYNALYAALKPYNFKLAASPQMIKAYSTAAALGVDHEFLRKTDGDLTKIKNFFTSPNFDHEIFIDSLRKYYLSLNPVDKAKIREILRNTPEFEEPHENIDLRMKDPFLVYIAFADLDTQIWGTDDDLRQLQAFYNISILSIDGSMNRLHQSALYPLDDTNLRGMVLLLHKDNHFRVIAKRNKGEQRTTLFDVNKDKLLRYDLIKKAFEVDKGDFSYEETYGGKRYRAINFRLYTEGQHLNYTSNEFKDSSKSSASHYGPLDYFTRYLNKFILDAFKTTVFLQKMVCSV